MQSIHMELYLHLPYIGNGKALSRSSNKAVLLRQLNKQNNLQVQRENPGFKKFSRGAAIAAQFPLQILFPAEPLTCCMTLNGPSLPQDSLSAFARLEEHHVTLALHMCSAQHSRARGPWHFYGTNAITNTIHRPILLQQSPCDWLSPHWATQVLFSGTKVTALLYQEGLLTCW